MKDISEKLKFKGERQSPRNVRGEDNTNTLKGYAACLSLQKIMITLQLKNLWEIPTASSASSADTTDFRHKIL